MLVISGNPFDSAQLSGEYAQDSVERQVLTTMSNSSDRYKFATTNQLRFELDLRREIVNSALDLSDSRFGFATFHDSECNEDYWKRSANGGFKLKSGVIPSEGLEDIYLNGGKYASECATAMVIVFYKAVLNVFGAAQFNRLFPSIYLMNWHSIDPILREIGSPRETGDIMLGDRGYFRNPEVDPKTPEWQGENVIILPESLYYGHGIGVMGGDRIIRALNANRKKNATQSAYLMDAVSRPNYKRIAELFNNAAPRTASLQWRAFPAPL